MSLLTPSGGLVYHWRAIRHRSGLWLPFRAALASWLERCFPAPAGELILVGPSAGHCLPLSWVQRFDRLTLLEPDALARAWLKARLGCAKTEFESRDALVSPLLSGQAGLEALLERRPGAAVLFCNVLGQLHFGLTDEQQSQFETEFSRRIVPALAGRAWASFHDRWSLDWTASERVPAQVDFDRQPSELELGAAWFGERGPAVTVQDHGTGTLFPARLARRYFSWQLTPSALHVIEAVGACCTTADPHD